MWCWRNFNPVIMIFWFCSVAGCALADWSHNQPMEMTPIPSVAVDGKGHWVAVSPGSVSISNTCGRSWTAVSVPPFGQAAVETDRAGTWLMSRLGDLNTTAAYFSNSLDNGKTWAQPSFGFEADSQVILATDRHGLWLAAYSRSGQEKVRRSTNSGFTWSDAIDVGVASTSTCSLKTDNHGVWMLVWPYWSTILVSTSTDGGMTWTPPSAVAPGDAVSLATDSAGTWMAACERRGVYAYRSTDDGGTWSLTLSSPDYFYYDSGLGYSYYSSTNYHTPAMGYDETAGWIFGDSSRSTEIQTSSHYGYYEWESAGIGTRQSTDGISWGSPGSVYSIGSPNPNLPAIQALAIAQDRGMETAFWRGGFDSGVVQFATETYPDEDGDGVASPIEDAGPNGGDANHDGIADKTQGNVVSTPNPINGAYMTAIVSALTPNAAFSSFTWSEPPGAPPTGTTFPFGAFSSDLLFGYPGGVVTVQFEMPPQLAVGAYYNYGYDAINNATGWKRCNFDGYTGATFDGSVATLHFVDGMRGDNDLAENGQVRMSGALSTSVDDTLEQVVPTPPGSPSGWSLTGFGLPGFAYSLFDNDAHAFRADITADPFRYRIAGAVANKTEWLPYAAIGPNRFAHGKFYVYANHALPGFDNTIPTFRLRLANRFACTSFLEVLHHQNADPSNLPSALELRPSSFDTSPSIYRLDFDPIDVPYLSSNSSEGVMPAFEAYSLDPQDNGSIFLTELSLESVPNTVLTEAGALKKVYATSPTDAGDLRIRDSSAELFVYDLKPDQAVGAFATLDTDSPQPTYSSGPFGVTLDSSAVPADRIGIVSRGFFPGSDNSQRVRVEEGKHYNVRFHVTSSQQSNLNAQLRLRARAVKFAWTNRLELGGAWATGGAVPGANGIIAQQLLPGLGCLNPDKDTTENGGWYTMLVSTPMNADIRAEFPPGTPLLTCMPNITSQPGPGSASSSVRDLKLGMDLVDTLSSGVNKDWEKGNFTLDRIEVRSYPAVSD